MTVEDADGKVVRHLAAGVLGNNARSRCGRIRWPSRSSGTARTTSAKRPRGTVSRHVRLGLTAEFDRFLLHNPEASGPVGSVAVGPGGTLYVFHRDGTVNGNMGGHKIKVYGPDGKHRKVLTPFPADIAADKVKARLGVFHAADGASVPHIYNWETLSFYPDNVGVRGRDMPEYSCPAVDSRGRVYWLVKGPALVAVDADGGIPYDKFLGPRLLPDIKDLRLAGELYLYYPEKPCLAVSPDDKHVYFAGLSTGAGDYKKAKPLPCVFRVDTARAGRRRCISASSLRRARRRGC